MNWKITLDKYITSGPPEDGFTEYCELIIDNFSDSFYIENEIWIDQINGIFDKWVHNS